MLHPSQDLQQHPANGWSLLGLREAAALGGSSSGDALHDAVGNRAWAPGRRAQAAEVAAAPSTEPGAAEWEAQRQAAWLHAEVEVDSACPALFAAAS